MKSLFKSAKALVLPALSVAIMAWAAYVTLLPELHP